MPSRAFVAGFFTTFILRRPGSVNRPGPRRLFLMMPLSDSNTAATCLRDSSLSLQIVATISDFVGAPPFFAITRLLMKKFATEKMLHRKRFGAQHSTAFPACKRIFLHGYVANALFSRLRRTCGSRVTREKNARELYESSPTRRARAFDST